MVENKNNPLKKIFHLWPISIYNENIGVEENIKNNLFNIEFELMENGSAVFSKEKYILDTDIFKKLKNKITLCVDNYVYNYLKIHRKFKHYFLNSWINKHIPGDWASSHQHRNSVISGVYYLQIPKNSGGVVFEKPHGYTNNFHETLGFEYTEKTLYNTDTFTLIPKEGEILLFPSHLLHSVQKNNTNTIRYSLAFNIFFEFEVFNNKSNIDYLKLTKSPKNEN